MDEFEAAFAGTSLPDQPDRGRVEDFLLTARKSVAG